MTSVLTTVLTTVLRHTSWGFLIYVAIGLLLIAGGLFNWDMTDRSAKFLVRVLGRTGARVIYVIIGLVLVALVIWARFA